MEQEALRGEAPAILIVGSIHRDHFSYVAELPRPGETVFASSTSDGLGGKGANQAIAATILGSDVYMAAAVGRDESGRKSQIELRSAGVSTLHVQESPEHRTGHADITVDMAGENTIVVHSGANQNLCEDEVALAVKNLAERSLAALVVVAQGEIPSGVLDSAAESCQRAGGRLVLNLAPVIPAKPDTLRMADPLVVNLGEARQLVRVTMPTSRPERLLEPIELASLLCRLAASVVITIGADGAVVATPNSSYEQPAFAADPVVDTTGAGDVFVGVMAAYLSKGHTLETAVRAGCAAASVAVSKKGTANSYPSYGELMDVLEASEARG